MKTKNMLFGVMLAASASLGFSACNSSPAVEDELIEKSASLATITDFPELVAGEEAGILQMREEEKMAHDVYAVLGEINNLAIFDNIAAAETNHYNAVGLLLSAYQLTDPSSGVAGTFTNSYIATLYDNLIASGKTSTIEALKVGALIEETDISDLEKLIAATSNSALLQVYGNLLCGSRNHLRTFVSTLSTYQVTYTPTILSIEDFSAIINSPMETLNGNGKENSGQGNRKNGKGTGICING